MDGSTFVSRFQALNIPGSDILNGNDFDWIFLEDSDLALFWECFFANIKKNDILSDEELMKFDQLLTSGSVLSEKHLKQMEEYLGSVSLEECVPQLDFSFSDDSLEEVDALEKRLNRLQEKKNIFSDLLLHQLISLQRMEIESGLDKKRNYIQDLKCQMKLIERNIQHVSTEHTKAMEKASHTVQFSVTPFLSFKCDSDEARLISQLSLQKWVQDENGFRDAVLKFIYKQFQEGIDAIAGQSSNPSCLLDVGQLDLQFVRGPTQAEYIKNVRDLNRLNKMLEETEVESVECQLKKLEKDAEMNEVIKFQKLLLSKPSYSLPLLRQQVSTLQETRDAVEVDFEFQLNYLKEQAMFVAQIERLTVISGNYDVKLKRQGYFLSKQAIVTDFFLSQLARLDFMKVVFDIENQKIEKLFEVLINLNQLLTEESETSEQRLTLLENAKEFSLQNRRTVREREVLEAILCSEEAEKESSKSLQDKELVQIAKNIKTALKQSEIELKSVSEAQLSSISKMFKACSMLEECLFGNSNSITSLPESWADCSIINRQASIEQTMWELQQQMFQCLKDYEKKKQAIQSNPGIQKELTKWIENIHL